MSPAPLPHIPVMGPWHRLHRAEAAILVVLLSQAEREAVRRRLNPGLDPDLNLGLNHGQGPSDALATWIPATAGPAGSRFCAPLGPGALYLGNDLATCLAEVAYHHGRACAASLGTPPGTRATLRHLLFQVSGTLADAARDRRQRLHDPFTYAPSWAYGRQVRAEHLPGIHARSVRRRGGRCLAIFQPQPLRRPRPEGGVVILEWDGTTSRCLA